MTGGYDAVMPPSYTGTVTWVLSADTMHIAMLTGPLAGQTVNFRLAKWDAWEDAGPMRLAGSLARASVLEWLPPDRAVTGLYLGTDAFGRPAGTISRASDGADLGSYLAAQGAAVAYPQPWERRAESGGNIPMLPLPGEGQACPATMDGYPHILSVTIYNIDTGSGPMDVFAVIRSTGLPSYDGIPSVGVDLNVECYGAVWSMTWSSSGGVFAGLALPNTATMGPVGVYAFQTGGVLVNTYRTRALAVSSPPVGLQLL